MMGIDNRPDLKLVFKDFLYNNRFAGFLQKSMLSMNEVNCPKTYLGMLIQASFWLFGKFVSNFLAITDLRSLNISSYSLNHGIIIFITFT